jgi:plasmid maintenance system antidote protein VapI
MVKSKSLNEGIRVLSEVVCQAIPAAIPPYPYKPDYAVHPGSTLLEIMCWDTAVAILGYGEGSKEPLRYMERGKRSDKIAKSAHKLCQQLHGVVTGHEDLTPGLIDRLEKWSGIPKRFWLALQTTYKEHPSVKKKENKNGTKARKKTNKRR